MQENNDLSNPRSINEYERALFDPRKFENAIRSMKKSLGITPTNDLVILRKQSSEESTSIGGIVLTGAEDVNAPWKGTVLSV